jgi:acyl-CoA thioester hydrolase
VYFDELDPMAMLHNSRYAVHVERATTALFESLGFRWQADVAKNPDQFHVVRRFEVDLRRPFAGDDELDVRLWVRRLGETSCSYAFACLGADGTVHASGQRTIVKLDPSSLRPAPWTARFRDGHRHLIEDNPNDA